MHVRTLLSALAAIAVTGLGLSAAPAVAAPATASSHVAAVRAADGLDVHRGKYVTLGGCQTAGQQGIERGHWDRYQCADGTFFWNLWTNR
ncbi:hypothetical protein JCM4814A_89710 [Streptomyces phaeofaciens JCM 4814]|uniref:Secreted protein n=1 Tax=Streptomyces phaeofaciens TaxID=68254 RepID=A0A918LZ34_9ACTN|nr:hypothetical protein [Streptomyces phaeofaciens]GGT80057.1 hypothetical protein GCM10010226_68170 [Streptomyces phaeofaciens]